MDTTHCIFTVHANSRIKKTRFKKRIQGGFFKFVGDNMEIIFSIEMGKTVINRRTVMMNADIDALIEIEYIGM